MNKILLFIICNIFGHTLFAQNITITSSCGSPQALGIYVLVPGDFGYSDYEINSCLNITNQTSCDSTINNISYKFYYDGDSWIWKSVIANCRWDFGSCISNIEPAPIESIIATNSANTPMPPCTGWIMVDSNFCEPILSDCTVLNTNGNVFSNKFKLYPNPTNGEVFVEFEHFNEGLEVELLNVFGQVIWNKKINQTTKLNINEPKGIYFLTVSGKNEDKTTFKFIKE